MPLISLPTLTCERCGQPHDLTFYEDNSIRSSTHINCAKPVPGPPNPPRLLDKGKFWLVPTTFAGCGAKGQAVTQAQGLTTTRGGAERGTIQCDVCALSTWGVIGSGCVKTGCRGTMVGIGTVEGEPHRAGLTDDGSMTRGQLEQAALIAQSRNIDSETAQELVYLRDQTERLKAEFEAADRQMAQRLNEAHQQRFNAQREAAALYEACRQFVHWYAEDSTEEKRDNAYDVAVKALALVDGPQATEESK